MGWRVAPREERCSRIGVIERGVREGGREVSYSHVWKLSKSMNQCV